MKQLTLVRPTLHPIRGLGPSKILVDVLALTAEATVTLFCVKKHAQLQNKFSKRHPNHSKQIPTVHALQPCITQLK